MDNDGIVCAQCGQPIIDESTRGELEKRNPCTNCGSLARTVSGYAQGTIALSWSMAQAEVITYPQTLLSTARSLINDGQFSISVVVAHMACEIATERSLSESFARNNIQHLEESITDLLNGYNLAGDRNRKLYTALTGDEIQNQPFWEEFKRSAKRRNNISKLKALKMM